MVALDLAYYDTDCLLEVHKLNAEDDGEPI